MVGMTPPSKKAAMPFQPIIEYFSISWVATRAPWAKAMLRPALASALTASSVVPTSATKKMAPAMRASSNVKPRGRRSGAVGFIGLLDACGAIGEDNHPAQSCGVGNVLDRDADGPDHGDGRGVDARQPVEVEPHGEGAG